MTLSLLIRLLVCITILGFTLYAFIDKQNELTTIRLKIPEIRKEVEMIKEENVRYQFRIQQFHDPKNLLEILRKPEFSHLYFPPINEIIFIDFQPLRKEKE